MSLGARGELRDWELENHPDKGRSNPKSFFSINARGENVAPVTRVLEAAPSGRLDATDGWGFSGLVGLPRFAKSRLSLDYPIATVEFDDDELPVQVSLTAFTPLVPLDATKSGIPAAVMRYSVHNHGSEALTVTIVGTLTHTAGRSTSYGPWEEYSERQSVSWRESALCRGLDFSVDLPSDDLRFGTLSLVTRHHNTTATPQWPIDFWAAGSQRFWDDLHDDGLLDAVGDVPLPTNALLTGSEPLDDVQLLDRLPKQRTGSLGVVQEIAPGAKADFEFVLAWSFPNRPRGWAGHILDSDNIVDRVRNYYATQWGDAWSAAEYVVSDLLELENATRQFADSMHDTTLDPDVVSSLLCTIATIRSTTCFRIDDGTFLAWEGSFDRTGSCEGTCTHVWSYAQSIAWLFPELERSARRVEYLLETDSSGRQTFRTNRVWGRPQWTMEPAVDGQLGTLVRLHREWRFSGDDDFLRELWPAAKTSLQFVLDTWDTDSDGLLDALMHNTYDIEFDGSEPLANIMLLAALAAAIRMGEHLGDDVDAFRCALRRGQEAVTRELFNGEYYRQRVDDVNARRFQYGDGVLSDQLLGQFHAHINGFGYLLPPEDVRRASSMIFASNYRSTLVDHVSVQRTYALGDEGGLVLASWPNGGRPALPFAYSDEVWTGVEYQVATELVYDGNPEAALAIVRSLRQRYDGRRRSPWNEIEAGYHYARSLASWGLLLAFSGAQWDAPRSTLAFTPPSGYRGFFSTGTAWGHVEVGASSITIKVMGGQLDCNHLIVEGADLGVVHAGRGERVRLSW